MTLIRGFRIIQCVSFSIVVALLSFSFAEADIADGKYGVAQVFDVQWNCSVPSLGGGCDYAPHPTEAVQYMTWSFAQPYSDTGRYDIGTGYIQFVATGGNGPHGTPSYKIVLFNQAGNSIRDINDGGEFYALSKDTVFYVSTTNQNGTVVTTSSWYSYGSSLNFTNNPALWPPSNYPVNWTISIPTVTEWGMIIFMVLAGLGAVYYLRKQKGLDSV